MKLLFMAALSVVLPSAAMAGSFDDETGIYRSFLGYNIEAPKGWLHVDSSNVQGMKVNLPENISPDALKRVDVIFFPYLADGKLMPDVMNKAHDDDRVAKNETALKDDPNMPKGEIITPTERFSEAAPKYVPMISILVLRAQPRQAPEAPKVYAKELSESANKALDINGYKVKDSTMDDALNAGSAYVFKSEFIYKAKTISVEQRVIFGSGKTLIVTCSSDANEQIDKNYCATAVTSLKFAP